MLHGVREINRGVAQTVNRVNLSVVLVNEPRDDFGTIVHHRLRAGVGRNRIKGGQKLQTLSQGFVKCFSPYGGKYGRSCGVPQRQPRGRGEQRLWAGNRKQWPAAAASCLFMQKAKKVDK